MPETAPCDVRSWGQRSTPRPGPGKTAHKGLLVGCGTLLNTSPHPFPSQANRSTWLVPGIVLHATNILFFKPHDNSIIVSLLRTKSETSRNRVTCSRFIQPKTFLSVGFASDARAQWGTAVLVSTLRELLGERRQSGTTQMTSGYTVMCVMEK